MGLKSYVATLTGPAARLSDSVGAGYDDLPYRQLLIEPAAANASDIPLYGSTFGDYARAVLASGPLAYYRLDETSGTTFADSSGNGHTLTQAGGVTFGAAGKIGAAATFDGVNDKASTSSGVDAWFGKDAISLEAWVFNAAWAATHEQILSLGSVGIYLSVTSGSLILSIHTGTQLANQAVDVLPTGVWTYLAGTWASGGASRLYVNGVRVNDLNNVPRTGTLSSGANIHLGAFGGSSLWYSGLIDEAAVYLRQLSAAEILNHYTIGSRTIGSFAISPGAKRISLGPFDAGPVKLSHIYAGGSGALTLLGVPY